MKKKPKFMDTGVSIFGMLDGHRVLMQFDNHHDCIYASNLIAWMKTLKKTRAMAVFRLFGGKVITRAEWNHGKI